MLSLVHLGSVVGSTQPSGQTPTEHSSQMADPQATPTGPGAAPAYALGAESSPARSDLDVPAMFTILQVAGPPPADRAAATLDDIEAALAQARAAALAAQRAYRHAAMLESMVASPAATAMLALFGRPAVPDPSALSRGDAVVAGSGGRVVPAGQVPEARVLRRD